MDIAEHMFTKCKGLSQFYTSSLVENITDLFYEIGSDLLDKRNHESAVQWFERAYEILGAQEFETLSAEAGELRLSVMQSIGILLQATITAEVDGLLVQANIKLKSEEGRTKAWHMLRLLETVSLEDIHLLTSY